jgi:hypothetical protein
VSVTQVRQALGSWSLRLRADTPRSVLAALDFFGHVAVLPARLDPALYGDGLLTAARYVGVLTGRADGDQVELDGAGMALWLGDADGKGDVYETPVVLAAETFADTIRALLPAGGSVTEGTLHSVPGTYTGRHHLQSPREAIGYVCETFGTDTHPVEWRVNGDGTLDAGRVSDLYATEPAAIIVRRGAGRDMTVVALPGRLGTERDVEDFTTRVILVAEGEGEAVATGSADAASVPYLDLHGNEVVRTRVVSESETSTGNADVRAQLQLNRFTGLRDAVDLSADAYDITGEFNVGDAVWVYDPDAGLFDTDNELTFRGQRINPMRLRVVEATWPVQAGMGVAFRRGNGTWLDLTDYVVPESGATTLKVGAFARSLTSSSTVPLGDRAAGDSTIPGAPSITGSSTGTYQVATTGETRAQIQLTWSTPLNVDGSTVIDGDHYEIRYRIGTGEYRYMFVGWGVNVALIQDLTPGATYKFSLRAVDTAAPPNAGDWSAEEEIGAAQDTTPPSTPAAPTVAGSRIAIQVIHDLGRATGGTFNLESDLDHLEVHVGATTDFTPDDSTKVGDLPAPAALLISQTPAISTFPVEETTARYIKVIAVDTTGNTSAASEASTATAELIDDAHISDLTVSKVTAGTIAANWLLGASIRTAATGARVELNENGLQAFNASGEQTVDIDADDGSVSIVGELASDADGNRVVVAPAGASDPEIRFYPSGSNNYAFISGPDLGDNVGIGMNSSKFNSDSYQHRVYLATANGRLQTIDPADQSQNGGVVSVSTSVARLAHQVGSTVNAEVYLESDGEIWLTGKWPNGSVSGSTGALYTSEAFIGAGFGGLIHSYGATMTGTMCPIYSIFEGSGFFDHKISARSSTGFTVSWSNTTQKNVHAWAFRV